MNSGDMGLDILELLRKQDLEEEKSNSIGSNKYKSLSSESAQRKLPEKDIPGIPLVETPKNSKA